MVLRVRKTKLTGLLMFVMILSIVFQSVNIPYNIVQAIEENLLINGSYEEGMTGWNTWKPIGNPQITVDNLIYNVGTCALRISANETGRAATVQTYWLSPGQKGKTYKFNQWVKTENLTGEVLCRIQLVNSTNGRVSYLPLLGTKVLKGTNEWTMLEKVFEVPDDQNVAGIKIENFFETGTGDAWFDGAQLIMVENETIYDMVVNGSYEHIADASSGRWSEWQAEDWNVWVSSGAPTVTVSHSVYKEGSKALQINAEQNSRVAVYQTYYISPEQRGRIYKFSQWIKTENLTGAGAFNRIQIKDSSGKKYDNVKGYIELPKLSGTSDWTLIEKIIEIENDERIATIVFENFFETGVGTAWYDDAKFLPWNGVTDITLQPQEVNIAVNETYTLDTQISPQNASDKRIYWYSSDENIATVTEGVIVGRTRGVAIITAETVDGGFKAHCMVMVGQQEGISVSNSSAETNQNSAVTGTITAQSDYGLELLYEMLVEPSYGTVWINPQGEWTYYPNENYYGEDEFRVLVKDTNDNFAVSKVNITVHKVNHIPTVKDYKAPTNKNTTISGNIKAEDADQDTLIYTKYQDAQHGTVSVNADGSWTYTPQQNYVGNDVFIVKVDDGNGGSAFSKVEVYMAPNGEDIIAQLKNRYPQNTHPRIMACAEDFERIKAELQTNATLQEWYDKVKQSTDSILNEPVRPYQKPDGLRLDTTSARRIIDLAFMYRVSGEQKYADRAWLELESVCSDAYPDWSPQHFLDTATMTNGVAIGYDWFYDVLTQEQRITVRNAIINKGLNEALPLYLNKTYWWVYNTNNWNFVCNSGIGIGALAIAYEEEELAGQVLRETFKSIQYGLTQYSPDGSALEGPAYWEYGTSYLVYFLAALDTALGNDQGFSNSEGIAETADFPIHIAGKQGTFNFSDNGPNLVPGRLLLWFANKFNRPELTWYHDYEYKNTGRISLYDILWYTSQFYGSSEPQQLDKHFIIPQAVSLRSSWSDPNGVYVGFKGGINGAPHGDLDTGTFVLDALGVRWAYDLGSEDYNLPGYWNMNEDGQRWTYYIKRAEGHNTLIINPSSKPDQEVKAVSEIMRLDVNRPQGAYAITDMTSAYKDSAASVKRGVALTNWRREFIVQDEIKAKTPSEIIWFMHTCANIEILEDGTSAILTQGDKRLFVKILSPQQASFTVMDAVPLPSSPNPDGQRNTRMFQKLSIRLNEVLNTRLTIWMVPLMPEQTIPTQTPQVEALDDWTIQEDEIATLNGIQIGEGQFSNFRPNRFAYEIKLPAKVNKVPKIKPDIDHSKYKVKIHKAKGIPGTVKIEVEDKAGSKKMGEYYVSFTHVFADEDPSDRPQIMITSVEASEDDGNIPQNTIDGNLNTRWSAYGNQWIKFDLGDHKTVSGVSIAWFKGNERSAFFNIEVSEDGDTWQSIYEGSSSGKTEQFEFYGFNEVSARYVRINGYGNNMNGWNSIAEVNIYGSQNNE